MPKPPEQITRMCPAAQAYLDEADQIIAMAQDLSARGLAAEAVTYALIAQERINAAKALQSMSEAARG